MVESVGFEPTEHVATPDELATRCLKPAQPTLRKWRCQGVTIPFFERDRLVCVHEHFDTWYGGRGETRTHTPISEPSVFKTAAAMPIRLTLP